MKTPKSFGGVTGVLSRGMSIVVILYVLMGFVGYVKYGEKVEGSITLNIPQGERLVPITANDRFVRLSTIGRYLPT